MNTDWKHEREAEVREFIAAQPQEIPCQDHPDQKCQINSDAIISEYAFNYTHVPKESWRAYYYACPACTEEKRRQRLTVAGVPPVLLHCTLNNWEPGNNQEKQHLESARQFAEKARRGFLVLLGPVGVGKSHLAVGVMRWFVLAGHCRWVKQSTLLRELRATYSDKKAADPIEKCQEAALLVLDEMGVSAGGRDELPMLQEILDYRYGHRLPTIITSNLTWDELRELLGDRLSDRLKESAYGVLVFAGQSHRAERRGDYFA